MRLSTSVRSAPRPASRRARFEPMKPKPPVIRTLAPANSLFMDGKVATNRDVVGPAPFTVGWPALPRPFAVLQQLLQPQARQEFIENQSHGFLRGLLVRVHNDLRILRRLIRGVDPG